MMETTTPAARPSDELMSRLNLIASRIDGLTQHSHDTHDRIDRIERRIDEESSRSREAFDRLQRDLDEKLTRQLTDSVRHGIQPEVQILRPSMEAQAARLAAVENRLERVETIQVESMNALDVRFGDLGFQTRLALSAGGLVTLGAIMDILLK